ERLNQIKLLAETGSNKIVPQAFDEIVKKGLTTTAVGSQIKFLPRNFLRDDEFIRNAKYFRDLTSETPRAHEISMRVGGDP
ncbi:hypothetical protein ACSLVQ_29825, partial [Klebsiella pneumoniae]|uniref:hypothetical protein n=1 Tax=Klebsiella pneumoniae TaxID=573 RepID=UPI003EE1366C